MWEFCLVAAPTSELSVPDIGEKGENTMKRKIDSQDMPVGSLKRIKDYLPSPEELAAAEETTKITLSLKKSSIAFFKRQAALHHTKYQRMIRELVDKYATQYS